MKHIIIRNQYRVDHKIGEGGCAMVYAGTDMHSNEAVAIKLGSIDDIWRMLDTEATIYEELAGAVGFPHLLWSGQDGDYKVMVIDLLGPSLCQLKSYCGGHLSLKTTLLLADQALSRLQLLHGKGHLHRDIKPSNFVMGTGRRGNVLYLIDFGLSCEYCTEDRDRRGGLAAGTTEYTSLNADKLLEPGRADDLEMLGYTLIDLHKGKLPWYDRDGGDDDSDDDSSPEDADAVRDRTRQVKAECALETLCEGLPTAFVTYMRYVRSLGFMEKPDYAYLRRLFRGVFRARGFKHDHVYDWTEKLFYEIQNQQRTEGDHA